MSSPLVHTFTAEQVSPVSPHATSFVLPNGSDALVSGARNDVRAVVYRSGQLLLSTVHYSSSSPDIWEYEAKFLVPKGLGHGQGTTDHPIVLEDDVSPMSFTYLIYALYGDVDRGNIPSLRAWLRVLELCNRWELFSLRHRVITEIEARFPHTLTPAVQQVSLGQVYGVAKWLKQGCFKLAVRESSITSVEAARLGLDTYVYILEFRDKYLCARLEEARKNSTGQGEGSGLQSRAVNTFDFDEAFHRIFSIGVERAAN